MVDIPKLKICHFANTLIAIRSGYIGVKIKILRFKVSEQLAISSLKNDKQ